jgi:hypothetical protein
MKEVAVNTSEVLRTVVSEGVGGLPDPSVSQLPNVSNMKRALRRIRKNAKNSLPNPRNLADIEIPDGMQSLANGENFLLYDSSKQVLYLRQS